MTLEDQEGQLYALEILQDDDEDQHQRNDPNDERSSGSAKARVSLARIGLLSRLYLRRRRTVRHLCLLRPLVP